MRSAYNESWLYNLAVIKETKRWLKANLIDKSQHEAISASYATHFYHPNLIIRILIFIASLIGLSGVTGLLALIILDADQIIISIGSLIYGVVSFYVVDKVIIQNSNHYKSGLTEALIYHACGFTIAGFIGLFDSYMVLTLVFSIIVLSFAAYRYLDLIATLASVLTFVFLIFYELFELGGIFKQIIPFIFIILFAVIYFGIKKLKAKPKWSIWDNNLVILESISLLFIYLAGNYLVVRELSVNLMDLTLAEGEDIPFAYPFYALTVLLPLAYLFFGIRKKDFVLIRTSLIVVAFSVFTFKYYYGFNHPEITLTIAGIILLGISLALLNYLKTMKAGYTRENLLSEKWSSMNAEAFIISQTMGGNQIKSGSYEGGGGSFGGGGASGNF